VTAIDGELLPTGVRLLHIGPHKTGTTALQAAFHRARQSVEAQGVHYAGRNAQPMGAAYAVTARNPTYAKPTPIGRWKALVREINGAGDARVVISSEGFCDADEKAIRRIARDLGPDRIHVVMTLRPLAAILPSQYQQFVQGGLTMPYEEWLGALLADPPRKERSPLFWHRHRHDELVARWANVVGIDRVTVIVADDKEPDAVPRSFEALVGLRPGTLELEWNSSNRSLMRGEIALVRALNRAFRSVRMRPMAQNKLMRLGATELITRRQPDKAEPRLVTPDWALARAAEISRQMVDAIAASGVRVIGDLEALAKLPARTAVAGTAAATDAATEADAARAAWPDVVTAAGMGVLVTATSSRRVPAGVASWPDAAVAAATDPIADPRGADAAVISNAALLGALQIRLRYAAGTLRRGIRRRLRAGPASRSSSIHSTDVEVQ
jgi:hypothetical protein